MTVTLHDVAARANLSIATVSRVVNGLSVSNDSRERVNAAIAELGYIPNVAARALRTDRSLTIGVIFADLRNTLGIDLLDALSESVENAGYSLIISTARGNPETYDTLMRRFLERRVDGLFCIRPPAASESLARYESIGIPIITMFDRGAAFADQPLVRPAFDEGAKDLAAHLREHSHSRIALVGPGGRSPAMLAVADAIRKEGLSASLIETPPGQGMDEVVAKVRATGATAAVITDPQVRGLLAACEIAGVRVPADLGVISVCEVGAEPYHRRHGISSLTIDPHRLGRGAGALMLAYLAGSKPASKVRVQHATFTARETLVAARTT